MLILDLLLDDGDHCARCNATLGAELAAVEETGATICLVCARSVLSAVSWSEAGTPLEIPCHEMGLA